MAMLANSPAPVTSGGPTSLRPVTDACWVRGGVEEDECEGPGGTGAQAAAGARGAGGFLALTTPQGMRYLGWGIGSEEGSNCPPRSQLDGGPDSGQACLPTRVCSCWLGQLSRWTSLLWVPWGSWLPSWGCGLTC